MTNNDLEIRRHDDGSIDIDFYRQRALRLRAEMMTGFFTGMAKLAKPLIAILILIGVLAMMPRQEKEEARVSASIISKNLLSLLP